MTPFSSHPNSQLEASCFITLETAFVGRIGFEPEIPCQQSAAKQKLFWPQTQKPKQVKAMQVYTTILSHICGRPWLPEFVLVAERAYLHLKFRRLHTIV